MRRVRVYLCDVGVAREEAPVDVGTIPDIRVVGFGSGLLEDLLDQTLGLIWLFEKELYYCRENLKLCLGPN